MLGGPGGGPLRPRASSSPTAADLPGDSKAEPQQGLPSGAGSLGDPRVHLLASPPPPAQPARGPVSPAPQARLTSPSLRLTGWFPKTRHPEQRGESMVLGSAPRGAGGGGLGRRGWFCVVLSGFAPRMWQDV